MAVATLAISGMMMAISVLYDRGVVGGMAMWSIAREATPKSVAAVKTMHEKIFIFELCYVYWTKAGERRTMRRRMLILLLVTLLRDNE